MDARRQSGSICGRNTPRLEREVPVGSVGPPYPDPSTSPREPTLADCTRSAAENLGRTSQIQTPRLGRRERVRSAPSHRDTEGNWNERAIQIAARAMSVRPKAVDEPFVIEGGPDQNSSSSINVLISSLPDNRSNFCSTMSCTACPANGLWSGGANWSATSAAKSSDSAAHCQASAWMS